MTPEEVTILKNEIAAILPTGIKNNISAAKIRNALYKAIDQLNVVDVTFTWGEVEGNIDDQADLVQYIAQKIAALVDSSPEALNTLNELASSLGNDPNFATTILNALGLKLEVGDLVQGDNITITINAEGKLVIASTSADAPMDTYSISTLKSYSANYVNAFTKREDVQIQFDGTNPAKVQYIIPAGSPTQTLTFQSWGSDEVTSLTFHLHKGAAELAPATTDLTTLNTQVAALTGANRERFQVWITPNAVGTVDLMGFRS